MMLLQSLFFPRFLPNQPHPLRSFDTHARWQPVTQSAQSQWSYGEIEDYEQSSLCSPEVERTRLWTDTCSVCTGEFIVEFLSLQQNFVTTTSHKFSLIWFLQLIAATNLCCGDKDFHKHSLVCTKWFATATCRCKGCCKQLPNLCRRSDLSPQHVAATCYIVCSDP